MIARIFLLAAMLPCEVGGMIEGYGVRAVTVNGAKARDKPPEAGRSRSEAIGEGLAALFDASPPGAYVALHEGDQIALFPLSQIPKRFEFRNKDDPRLQALIAFLRQRR